MRLSQLLQQPTADDIQITQVVDDSRAAAPGVLCVLDARNHPNTADYAAKAAAAGATVVANIEAENIIYHPTPGAVLARWAVAQHPKQPVHRAAVTGTNGKTSVAWFYQQLVQNSASIGTLGVYQNNQQSVYTGYTSPTALKLHPILHELTEQGVTHVCCETSSHALDIHRLDGMTFQAAALTNITQDHLDYHGTMEAYIAAKMKLFTERLDKDGTAVINIQNPASWPVLSLCKEQGFNIITTGSANAELVVDVQNSSTTGMELLVKAPQGQTTVQLPLLGAFQAQNIATALGLAMGTGVAWEQLVENLPKLSGVPGRMELFTATDKPSVVVDYAHTADALATALAALKPLTQQAQSKLWVVFGAGGDRDPGKRQPMGAAAQKYADEVIVTDDNPRTEDATSVRQQILQGCPKAQEIADRAEAIAHATSHASPNDIVLVAGKGHEEGQIIGTETHPFNDRTVVQALLKARAA